MISTIIKHIGILTHSLITKFSDDMDYVLITFPKGDGQCKYITSTDSKTLVDALRQAAHHIEMGNITHEETNPGNEIN